MPNMEMNRCNERNFMLALSMLESFARNNLYQLETVYLDYRAGMKWETLICYRNGHPKNSYQMLSPMEWDELQSATTATEIAQIVDRLLVEQNDLLGIE